MEKIILFYKFCFLPDSLAVRLWQEELCRRLQLKGRLIVAKQGLNGTLGGTLDNLKAYKKALNEIPVLRDIDYKWLDGCSDDFPKLSVKVRPELVTLAAKKEFSPLVSSTALTPRQWHRYLEKNPQVLVLDARNYYESELGYFKVRNLIRPNIKSFKDIKKVVENLPKDQPILTYCTGDVRCEYLSAYMMQSLGFGRVYHLEGGIVKYGEVYKDNGFWHGKCYVFDRRMNIGFSVTTVDIAKCVSCKAQTSEQVNCDDCNSQLVVCSSCQTKTYRHCQNPAASSRKR